MERQFSVWPMGESDTRQYQPRTLARITLLSDLSSAFGLSLGPNYILAPLLPSLPAHDAFHDRMPRGGRKGGQWV